MTITLRPEQEKLIAQAMQSGGRGAIRDNAEGRKGHSKQLAPRKSRQMLFVQLAAPRRFCRRIQHDAKLTADAD
jgi:hypothetical protein